MIDSLQKLFEDTVKDVYNAEKQFLRAMPKMAKAVQNPMLKKALERHATQTEEQIKRLEEVATFLEIRPAGKVCKAAQGLVAEAEEHLEEVAPGPALDAAIAVCAQKNEHYEICSYGTLIAWATELEYKEIVPLLEKTLKEEKATNSGLTKIAVSRVNEKAEEAEAPAPAKAKSSGSKSKASLK